MLVNVKIFWLMMVLAVAALALYLVRAEPVTVLGLIK